MLRKTLKLICLIVGTSCATTNPEAVQQAMCDQFDIITFSRYDTEETVRQIGIHNNVMEALCGE